MSDITVIFQNQPPIHIELYNSTAATQWKQLFLNNYQREFPVFRDMQKYSLHYLEQLVQQANETCGWNFTNNIVTLEDTVALHKHIEVTLANGYQNVPKLWHHLLDELHFALHAFEQNNMSRTPGRGYFLQLEWFNNDFVPLPDDFEFNDNFKFGAIRLQNAYVGHTPLMVYAQNDHINIFQTCKFHDRIKPGLHIMTARSNTSNQNNDISKYQNWWKLHAPEFVAHHGIDKIMYYTGYPLIGQVINIRDLEIVYNYPGILALQSVIVN